MARNTAQGSSARLGAPRSPTPAPAPSLASAERLTQLEDMVNEALVDVEALHKQQDGADGHALATGFRRNQGGRRGGSGGRHNRGGRDRARGRRGGRYDGRCLHNNTTGRHHSSIGSTTSSNNNSSRSRSRSSSSSSSNNNNCATTNSNNSIHSSNNNTARDADNLGTSRTGVWHPHHQCFSHIIRGPKPTFPHSPGNTPLLRAPVSNTG